MDSIIKNHRFLPGLFIAVLFFFPGISHSGEATNTLTPLARHATYIEKTLQAPARPVPMRGVRFSSRDFTLRVVDNPGGEKWSLAAAMRETGALAGTNGGYFHEDFRPLGLVIIHGKTTNALRQARLLSGIITAGTDGIDLVRPAEAFPNGVTDALQAGPFLVDCGKAVPGLDSNRVARRTFVATDGHRNWFLGNLGPCTLAEAGAVLASAPLFESTTARRALNLDGGHSTGLWVDLPGAPLSLGPISRVRNYLAVQPKN